MNLQLPLDGPGIEIVRSVMKNQVDQGGLLILATNNPEEVTWCGSAISIEDFKKKVPSKPLKVGQMPASQS